MEKLNPIIENNIEIAVKISDYFIFNKNQLYFLSDFRFFSFLASNLPSIIYSEFLLRLFQEGILICEIITPYVSNTIIYIEEIKDMGEKNKKTIIVKLKFLKITSFFGEKKEV